MFRHDGKKDFDGNDYQLSRLIEEGKLDDVHEIVNNACQRTPTKKTVDKYYQKRMNYGLATAVEKNDTKTADFLLSTGAAADAQGDMWGQSALGYLTVMEYAILKHQEEMFHKLFAHGGHEAVKSAISNLFGRIGMYLEHPEYYKNPPPNKEQFERIAKVLFDHAQRVNFDSLDFLKRIESLADLSFIGVSCQGKPVTKAMLAALNLNGAEQCHVTRATITDDARRQNIAMREVLFSGQDGKFIQDGVVNLVPFMDAVRAGELETVKARLSGTHKISPEMLAAGYKEAIKLNKAEVAAFLQPMQDLNQADEKGNTLLHTAVMDGNVQAVTDLIAKKVDLEKPNTQSKATALRLAVTRVVKIEKNHDHTETRVVSANHLQIVELLLKAGANPYNDVGIHEERNTIFEEITKTGHLPLLLMFMPYLDKEKRFRHYRWHEMVLQHAYKSPEYLAILRWLDVLGLKLDVYLEDFEKPLSTAMRRFSNVYNLSYDGENDCEFINPYSLKKEYVDTLRVYQDAYAAVAFLLEKGADPHTQSAATHGTALSELIHQNTRGGVFIGWVPNGYARIIDKFLKHGYKIDSWHIRYTLLQLGVMHGKFDMVKALAASGSDVNARSGDGKTALHFAVTGNTMYVYPCPVPEMVELLLTLGADVNAKDREGLTPLEFAEQHFNDRKAKSEYKDAREIAKAEKRMQQVIATLKRGTPLQPKPEALNRLSEKVLELERNCEILLNHVNKLTGYIPSPEDEALLSLYQSCLGQKLITPVMLNGRVYDLSELVGIDEVHIDPVTQKPFGLHQIEPAEHVYMQLCVISQLILEKYPEAKMPPQPKKIKQSDLVAVREREGFNQPAPAERREEARNDDGLLSFCHIE